MFVVVDGLDGIGKGTIESALLERIDGAAFDSVAWCKANPTERPDISLLGAYDAVLTAEPTYSGLGMDIRKTLISNANEGTFPSGLLIRAYALDREIQMRGFVVPALEMGYPVLQSRSMATSLCYQTLSAEDEGSLSIMVRDGVLRDPGNIYQLENAPDLLIIPTIGDIDELMSRLGKRDKKDDAIFERREFLERAKGHYESDWLRDIFEDAGSKIAYLDAGISVEESRDQAVEIYDGFLSTGNVPKEFRDIVTS